MQMHYLADVTFLSPQTLSQAPNQQAPNFGQLSIATLGLEKDFETANLHDLKGDVVANVPFSIFRAWEALKILTVSFWVKCFKQHLHANFHTLYNYS